MVELLIRNPDADSVRSVVASPETPFKMWFRDSAGMLTPVIQTEIREAYNQPRQCLPPTFLQNASIDVVRSSVITDHHSMTGKNILGYVMKDSYDIDTEHQFHRVEAVLEAHTSEDVSRQTPLPTAKTFVFDIDGVIATLVPSLRYEEAQPNYAVIRLINLLYQQGHRIILFTARGGLTGQDWTGLTHQQMTAWGVRYHELSFGKPAADYYLDDKLLSISQLKALVSSWGLDPLNGRTL